MNMITPLRFGESFKIRYQQIDALGRQLKLPLRETSSHNEEMINGESKTLCKTCRFSNLSGEILLLFVLKQIKHLIVNNNDTDSESHLLINGKTPENQHVDRYLEASKNSRHMALNKQGIQDKAILSQALDEFHRETAQNGLTSDDAPEVILRYDPYQEYFPFLEEDLKPVLDCLL